jgi:hypothetical protein
MRTTFTAITLVLAALLLITACGDDKDVGPKYEKNPTPPPLNGQVLIKDFATAERLLPFKLTLPTKIPAAVASAPLFKILNPEPRVPEDGQHYEFSVAYSGLDFRLLDIRQSDKSYQALRLRPDPLRRAQIMRDVTVEFREISDIARRPGTNQPIPGSQVWWNVGGITYTIFAVNLNIGDVLGVADLLIQAAKEQG